MENELAVVPPETGLTASLGPDPKAILIEAHKRAMILQDVIENSTRKPLVFGGNKYLYYEHLQVLGRFYGIGVKTGGAEPVDIDGIKGAKATSVLLDSTGEVIGGAEAYCLRDEKQWADKPWFQLASMAQTRAGAKALRNRLGWVPVLAGYDPTPAEEMTGETDAKDKAIAPPKAKEVAKSNTEVDQIKNDNHYDFVPDIISKKIDKNNNTRWSVHLPDGKWAGTYSEKLANVIFDAKKNKQKAVIYVEANGDFINVVDVVAATCNKS